MACLNCGKEVIQAGNRPKLYCGDSCRMSHKRSESANKNVPESPILDELCPTRTIVPSIRTAYPNKILNEQPIRTGALPENYGQPDCQCRHCQNNIKNNLGLTINHGKRVNQTNPKHVNRVSLPGDIDYIGVGHKTAQDSAGLVFNQNQGNES